MVRRRAERGFTLIELLVSVALFVTVMAIGLSTMSAAAHGFSREAETARSQTVLDRLADQLTASAHTSVSVFTPASCGGGGAGDGQSCADLRFYGADKTGASHIWGWEYVAGVLKECLSYPSADGTCSSYGDSTSVTAFSATPTSVTNLNLASTLGYTPTAKELEVASSATDPNGRVVAGNRVTIVHVSDANVQREIHLLQGGAPFSESVIKGSFTPPPLGNLGTSVAPSSNVFFMSTATGCSFGAYTAGAGVSPCQVTATETNYSKYEPYITAPYWTATSCSNGSWTVATVAQVAADGNGDQTTWTISPQAAGSCTFTISTHDQSVTVNVTVYAIPTYTIADSGPSPANIIVPASTSLTATAAQNPAPAGTSYPPGTSNAPAQVQATLTSGNATNNVSGWQPSGTTFTFTGQSYSTVNGVINANPPVSNGVVTNANLPFTFNVWDLATYAISASPTSIGVTVGGTASWTASSNVTNSVQAGVPQGIQPATLPVYGTGSGNCAFSLGEQATPGSFSAVPLSAGDPVCVAGMQDTHNDTPVYVYIDATYAPLTAGTPYCSGSTTTSIGAASSSPSGGDGNYSVYYTIINPADWGGASGGSSAPYYTGQYGFSNPTTITLEATYYDYSAGVAPVTSGPFTCTTEPLPPPSTPPSTPPPSTPPPVAAATTSPTPTPPPITGSASTSLGWSCSVSGFTTDPNGNGYIPFYGCPAIYSPSVSITSATGSLNINVSLSSSISSALASDVTNNSGTSVFSPYYPGSGYEGAALILISNGTEYCIGGFMNSLTNGGGGNSGSYAYDGTISLPNGPGSYSVELALFGDLTLYGTTGYGNSFTIPSDYGGLQVAVNYSLQQATSGSGGGSPPVLNYGNVSNPYPGCP